MDAFIQTYGFTIITMLISAMLALSLYLPLMAGQLSLASPGFYAIGGYVGGLLSTQNFRESVGAQNSYPVLLILLEMLIAAALCGALAYLIGRIVLRLRGIFLALATISFVEIVRVGAIVFVDFTKGQPGIENIPQPFPTKFGYMWLMLPTLLLCMFGVYRLERIRAGRAFTAIRADELAASSIGIDTTHYKVLAFVIGGILAGIAGAISAHLNNTWNPSFGTFDASILILASVLVGGSRTFVGPVIGGMLITAMPEALRALAGIDGMAPTLSKFIADSRLIIFGILITLGAIAFPEGLVNPDFWRRITRRRVADEPTGGAPSAAVSATAGTGGRTE
jgi:branched-chain amino acid transport system permease protein